MNRLRLCLTGVAEKLTKEAENKLDASEKSILEPVCDNGNTLEYYEDMGFSQNKIPKELIQRQKDFDLGIELKDEDYEEIISDVVVYEDQIVTITEDVETNTTIIYLNNLMTIRVAESPFEIDSIIDYMKMSWFDKKYILFLNFFSAKKK